MTVLFLVALRVTIGWHFFAEGLSHHRDKNWSSEPFLRQAKGPFAHLYQSSLPDFYGWEELISHPYDESPAKPGPGGEAKKAPASRPKTDKPQASLPPRPGAADDQRTSLSAAPPSAAAANELVALAYLVAYQDDAPPAATDQKPASDPPSDKPAADSAPTPPTETSTPPKSTPDTSTPSTATPDKATPDKATPDKATPDKATPDKATPDKATPDKAASPPNEGNPKGEVKTAPASPAPPEPAKLPTEGAPSPKPADAKQKEREEQRRLQEEAALANPIYGKFAKNVLDAWTARGAEIARFYDYDSAQRDRANALYARYKTSLLDYLAAIEDDLRLYQRDLTRSQAMGQAPGANQIPFASKRLADIRRENTGKTAEWLSTLRLMDNGYTAAISSAATDEQEKKRGQFPPPENRLRTIDRAVSWMLMIVGAALIVGLLTRTAALIGAGFLLSVILSQPFWIEGTAPTFNQAVECVALLALATTRVGRWGGLDFFVHLLIAAPFGSARSSKDA